MRSLYLYVVVWFLADFNLLFAQSWGSLNGGLNQEVRVLYADTIDDVLYVGGPFTFADTVEAHSIVKWDGQKWESLGVGPVGCFNACNPVLAITKYAGELYAGGMFRNMDSVPNTEGIAKWNDTAWQSFGGGWRWCQWYC